MRYINNTANKNIKMKLFMIASLFIMNVNLYGQSCTWSNKGFDDYTSCPNGLDQVSKSVGWFKGTVSTPDYYYASAPCNFAQFNQVPDVLTPPLPYTGSCSGFGFLSCGAGVNGYTGLYLNSSTAGGLYNAPSSGTMTITVSGGGSQVFTAPFTSPTSYSISGR